MQRLAEITQAVLLWFIMRAIAIWVAALLTLLLTQ